MITDDQLKLLLEKSRQILVASDDFESVLQYLRQTGCTKVDSMRVIVELRDLTLDDAKRIVHFSKTWEDVRKRDEEWHDQMLRDLGNNSV